MEKSGICLGALGTNEDSENDDGGVNEEEDGKVVTGGELLGTENDEVEDDGVNEDDDEVGDDELENEDDEGDENLRGAAGDPMMVWKCEGCSGDNDDTDDD